MSHVKHCLPHIRQTAIASATGILLMTAAALAQPTIPRSVIGSGAVHAEGNGLRVTATVGQTLIGPVSRADRTIAQGFWALPSRTTTSGIAADEGIRASAGSLAVYPNPASSATTIRAEIIQPGRPLLRIVDALGRNVRSLPVDYREAGELQLQLDVAALEPGRYAVELTVAGRRSVTPLLIVR